MIARYQWLIAVVALLAFLLIALAFHVNAETQTKATLYADIPLNAQLLELDKQALDEAYHAHLVKLWTIWVTDGASETKYISRGLKIARAAYQDAAAQMAKRQQEIKP